MASIRLENLRKAFGPVVAVDTLSLEIPDGEFAALLGPSGCGKTTTMNMIAGLEVPTSGSIYFNSQDMTRTPAGKRGVGFVFQNYAIFTHMTVEDNIGFGLKLSGAKPDVIKREVRDIAELLQFTAMLPANAGRLSINDMQKVALGRSMIMKPGIFLLDEPFSNLDAAFPRVHARRTETHPAPAGADDDLCHPRPGRGHEHGRQDRGDVLRRAVSVRLAG